MIRGQVQKVKELSKSEIDSMFQLMNDYYDNFHYDTFITDLSKKDSVIVLRNENAEIKGFSTIVFYDMKIKNNVYKILFSGDTIIHKDYWAQNDLPAVWLKFAFEKQKEFNKPLYWLLISKGYKTYKYLNTFFKSYYPNPNAITPEIEQSLIDEFGKVFYPDKYDKEHGILRMNGSKDYLKKEFAEISEEKIKNDKIVQFFLEKNPKYYDGNELVCIAEVSSDNLSKAGKKALGI